MSARRPVRPALFASRPMAWALILALAVTGCVNAPKASEAQRESAAIHFQLGVEHLRRGQTRQAESSLLRSLELDGRSADALAVLGVLYQRTRRPDEAEKVLRRALALAPRSVTHGYLPTSLRDAGGACRRHARINMTFLISLRLGRRLGCVLDFWVFSSRGVRGGRFRETSDNPATRQGG